MKKKDLFFNIIEPVFKDIVEPLGYSFNLKSEMFFAKRLWGYDMIRMAVLNYGVARSLSPIFSRRYDCIEEVVEKFFHLVGLGKTFGDTLQVGENQLDMVSSGSRNYMIINYDGTVFQNDILHLREQMLKRIFPFLNKMETIENLHEFINVPVDRFEGGYTNFFPLDGMTLFRKMIIAKLVNKEYDEVCIYVYNKLQFALEAVTDEDSKINYIKYLNCYQEIKKFLDNSSVSSYSNLK